MDSWQGTQGQTGEIFGDYVLEALARHGPLGEVWKGRHRSSGQCVAIQILSTEVRLDRASLLSFNIPHPRVMQVLGCDVQHCPPYLITEWIDGPTLRQRLAERPLPLVESLEIFAVTLETLAAAHLIGRCHGHLTAEAILLHPQHGPLLADFGLADGEIATMTADVYAAGLILQEMLTGQREANGPKLTRCLFWPLDEVCERACGPRSDRYPDAMAMREDFQRAGMVREYSLFGEPEPLLESDPPAPLRLRFMAITLEGLILFALFFFWTTGQPAPSHGFLLPWSAAGFLYFLLFDWLLQATPVKILLGLRIVSQRGPLLDLGDAFWRLSLAIVLLPLSPLALSWRKRYPGQALHDRLAETKVVRSYR